MLFRSHGEADRVDFVDEHRALIRNASFTTCRRLPGPSWMPDWILRAASISIDNEEEIGQAEGGLLTFKNVPLLPIPSFSFPLSSKRKSGFLPPTFGVDNVNGLEFSLPYYWNIAPNRDATLFPALLSKRGVDLAGEFRYLCESMTQAWLTGAEPVMEKAAIGRRASETEIDLLALIAPRAGQPPDAGAATLPTTP